MRTWQIVLVGLTAASLFNVGCATGGASRSGSELHRVLVNGEQEDLIGDPNVRDLLIRRSSWYRLLEWAPAEDQPLVLVDGVAMVDGIRSLIDVRAFDIASVTLVRRTEAVANYGARAREGAIVILTRRGRR